MIGGNTGTAPLAPRARGARGEGTPDLGIGGHFLFSSDLLSPDF
jgi:hypothetical protein